MNLSVGIVGLPNVGKSTLFNALLKKRVALSANYPFATVEPNVGVVAVPDPRLDELAKLVAREDSIASLQNDSKEGQNDSLKLPPIVPAAVSFLDIAGLVKGASTGEGLGNQFLSHIREVDAIVHVIRDFEDKNVIRSGSVDPTSDKEIIETELALADIQTLEKLISNQEKEVKASKDPLEVQKLQILNQVQDDLNQVQGDLNKVQDDLSAGKSLSNIAVEEKLKDWFSKLPLLSKKPVLYVYNVSEDVIPDLIGNREKVVDPRFRGDDKKGGDDNNSGDDKKGGDDNNNGDDNKGEDNNRKDDSLFICAKLEEELVDLAEDERIEYLKQLGLEQTGLERLIVKAYEILGLISFLTAGKKEVRAWTLRRGETALRASGTIHTDFEKNFIRAQVIEYAKLVEVGSFRAAKDKGLIRAEGKEYAMQDGDVVEFLVGS